MPAREHSFPPPVRLKAYLTLALEWQSPMLEALWLLTPNIEFQELACAAELRRTALVPLLEHWIPPNSSITLLNGSELVKLCVGSSGVSVSYRVLRNSPCNFVVERETAIADQNGVSGFIAKKVQKSWLKFFKLDAIANYAVERLVAELCGPYSPTWKKKRVDAIKFKLVVRKDYPGGWELRVNAHFSGIWTGVEVTRTQDLTRKTERVFLTVNSGRVLCYKPGMKTREYLCLLSEFQIHTAIIDRIQRRHAALLRKAVDIVQ